MSRPPSTLGVGGSVPGGSGAPGTPSGASANALGLGPGGADADGILREGWTTKCGGKVKSWKRRWLRLTAMRGLEYFVEGEEGGEGGNKIVGKSFLTGMMKSSSGSSSSSGAAHGSLPDGTPNMLARKGDVAAEAVIAVERIAHKRPNVAKVFTPDRAYLFSFDTRDECDQWVRAIRRLRGVDGVVPCRLHRATFVGVAATLAVDTTGLSNDKEIDVLVSVPLFLAADKASLRLTSTREKKKESSIVLDLPLSKISSFRAAGQRVFIVELNLSKRHTLQLACERADHIQALIQKRLSPGDASSSSASASSGQPPNTVFRAQSETLLVAPKVVEPKRESTSFVEGLGPDLSLGASSGSGDRSPVGANSGVSLASGEDPSATEEQDGAAAGKHRTLAELKELLPASFSFKLDDVQSQSEVGRGEYGVVFKGIWRNQQVAVKEVIGTLSRKQEEEFVGEALLMVGLRPHLNVVQLLGVSVEPRVCILVQFYPNGSLRDLLRSDRRLELTWGHAFRIMCGVAAGLAHIHSEWIVHRDLAARNVLVAESLEPAVSDFGFARSFRDANSDIERSGGEHMSKAGVGPIRWMAIESLTHRTFSYKSDVWSLGVVIWEVISAGKRPFGQWDNIRTISEVLAGARLPIPDALLSGPLAELGAAIQSCWITDPSERASAQQVFEQLSRCRSTFSEHLNSLAFSQ